MTRRCFVFANLSAARSMSMFIAVSSYTNLLGISPSPSFPPLAGGEMLREHYFLNPIVNYWVEFAVSESGHRGHLGTLPTNRSGPAARPRLGQCSLFERQSEFEH
jgi:hypothetical protein